MTQQVVFVADGLFQSNVCQPGRLRIGLEPGEGPAVHFPAAVVVVDRDAGIGGCDRGRDTGVVVEAVGSPVQCPEFEVLPLGRGRVHGISGDTVERTRTLEDPGLSDENLVGVGGVHRAVAVPESKVRQPITGFGVWADRCG
ncbi:hypothetical protein AB0E01_43540 [Nocardia vinacea]|uniref:hypothetical protein n=1 Tax=Nocardia vinacea TaxID=96468 RepID=UPI0034102541